VSSAAAARKRQPMLAPRAAMHFEGRGGLKSEYCRPRAAPTLSWMYVDVA
jgi:hypothetical protein